MAEDNKTIIQYFEWYLPNDKLLWKRCIKQASNLKESGITTVWLPPAYKGAGGEKDVGYAVYDMYDLGEFDQRNSIPTKYGTKDEYLKAIESFQKQGICVLADIVFNHRIGADDTELVKAEKYSIFDRNKLEEEEKEITAWTKYTFPGRKGMYSDFQWDWSHFDGTDWDDKTKETGIYKFRGKSWEEDVDNQYGNYDYLMGADVDMSNKEVLEELDHWGEWYIDLTKVDGFRLDAVKHIRFTFFTEWLAKLRKLSGKELFAVGEYWSANIEDLTYYLEKSEYCMSLFDVPLHMKFHQITNANGNFNMQELLKDTLLEKKPEKAVTFVDNHDTQMGQALESWVGEWFKPIAYAIILLQDKGYPCVFYGDYYGIPQQNLAPVKGLFMLLKVRKYYAYGPQHNYFDHFHLVGFTRQGDWEHEHSGLAVLLSDGPEGEKEMFIGKHFAGIKYRDCMQHRTETVIIDEEGKGIFYTAGGSVSVWVKECIYEKLIIEK